MPRERGFEGRLASPVAFAFVADGFRVAAGLVAADLLVVAFFVAVLVPAGLVAPGLAVALRPAAARGPAADAVGDVVGLASGAWRSPVAKSGSGEAGCNALIAP